jgi:hypothetical protein
MQLCASWAGARLLVVRAQDGIFRVELHRVIVVKPFASWIGTRLRVVQAQDAKGFPPRIADATRLASPRLLGMHVAPSTASRRIGIE